LAPDAPGLIPAALTELVCTVVPKPGKPPRFKVGCAIAADASRIRMIEIRIVFMDYE
jgi:hypothetical protein